MQQLTVRGFSPELVRALRATARRLGTSLNKAALHLIRRGAGLREPGEEPDVIGSALDQYVGTWSREEAQQVMGAVRELDGVDDQDFWR